MNCGEKHGWAYMIALSAWQGLEHWLGKTDKVEASSTPSLIFNCIELIFTALYRGIKRIFGRK